jgi:hypothetical protein
MGVFNSKNFRLICEKPLWFIMRQLEMKMYLNILRKYMSVPRCVSNVEKKIFGE